MMLAISVREPDFWRSSEVSTALSEGLDFATEDEWLFTFSQPREREASQLQLIATDAKLHGDPGSIVLFSGGADSLCAAVQAHREGAQPLLVSHRPSPPTGSHQQRLVDELRSRFAPQGFRQVGAVINRRGSEAADDTQRSRSFLFASLGAAVGGVLSLDDIRLADNGVVSINLPITDQAVGAMASRSTHPLFLRRFQRLARLVVDDGVRVWNPFWNRTRSETLHVLAEHSAAPLLGVTHSCSHPRHRTIAQPHCGTCSQCVDRRFGALAAHLEEHDPATRYEVDVFRDHLKDGEPRTVATSYVRFALRTESLSDDEMFLEFPQLNDCVDMANPGVEAEASELTQMLRRHAGNVLSVMREQLALNADDLLRRRLPSDCLVTLAQLPAPGASRQVSVSSSRFDHSPDFATVVFDQQTYSLGSMERAGIKLLYEAWQQGTPDLAGAYLLEKVESSARSVSELFRHSGLWKTLVIVGGRQGLYRLNLK